MVADEGWHGWCKRSFVTTESFFFALFVHMAAFLATVAVHSVVVGVLFLSLLSGVCM